MPSITPEFWFQDYKNIVMLTAFMAENDAEPGEIAEAVEKPWKYTEMFEEALAEASA